MKLHDPVFSTDVILSTGKIDGEPLAGYVQTEDETTRDGRIFRRYHIHIEDPHDFYTLLHESTHLVRRIMTDRGIPFTPENDEVIAYLQTYWFKRLWRRLSTFGS